MPRHSSFQIFSDTTTKVVTGYAEGALIDPSTGADDGEKVEGRQLPGGGVISNKIVTERVDNVMGSVAGAGSCEFHKYLDSKKRETRRMLDIETRQKQKDESEEFAGRLEKNKNVAEERTRKNSEKRKRKKENIKAHQKAAKLVKTTGQVEDKDKGEESDHSK